MDSVVIAAEQLNLFARKPDGSISAVLSCSPRNPLNLRDLQVAPDGRQVLAISNNPEQGVCFACLTQGQNGWLYYDFMPTDFIVTCGVHSPTVNHIVYLGTSAGSLVQFDLKTKLHAVLTKCSRNGPVSSIDVNCTGTQLAASVAGSIVLHSIRNKLDNNLIYDTKPNAEVFIRYHPFRPNTLGVFSLEEGAALVDVSPAQPKLPNQSSRFKPLPGEAHVCKPCAILWGTTETLVTIANDGRIVYYGKKSCGLLYRHSETIYSACILKDGSEILLGLENGIARFDWKKKVITWIKTLSTIKAVQRIARAKSYLPLATQKSGIESMYPQKVAFNPDIRPGCRRSSLKQSDGELISPLKGSPDATAPLSAIGSFALDLKEDKRRRSSLGSMISPPKSHNSVSSQLSAISIPSRRTFASAPITEETFADSNWKENDKTILQSTILQDVSKEVFPERMFKERCDFQGEDVTLGKVDFGLDSTSPVRPPRVSTRQPLSNRQSERSNQKHEEPKAKAVFCNVDASRSLSKLSQDGQQGMASLLEHQNSLLSQLAQTTARIETKLTESSARVESKLNELLEEIREQGASDRRLVGHGIQLVKTYHNETVNVLTEMVEAQRLEWLDQLDDYETGGKLK